MCACAVVLLERACDVPEVVQVVRREHELHGEELCARDRQLERRVHAPLLKLHELHRARDVAVLERT